MRKTSLLLLAALALVQSSLAITSASAQDDDLKFIAKSNQFKAIDVGTEDESLGDHIVFNDKLYDADDRDDKVGTLDGFCVTTYVKKKDSRMECVVTMKLDDGQITAQGVLWSDADEFTIAVTGGTEDYNDASGDADVEFVNDEKAKIEVNLN